MKLELTKHDTVSCKLLRDRVCSREETLEMIVPDAYPDIAEILDTNSFCCLTKRELTESGAMLAGTIKTFVLYRPEGKNSVERLEAELPFQHMLESDKLEGNCSLQAKAEVMSAETRTINSRKVLIRVDLKESAKIYKPELRAICCGIQDEAGMGVQQKTEHYQMTQSRMPREKCFTVEEELNLQDGKSDIERILSIQPRIYCSEARMMGSKLVLKGGIQIRMLGRRQNGELSSLEFDLPVSQMVEAEELGEGARYQTEFQILNWQLGTLMDDGRSVSIIFDLAAQAQFYEVVPVAVLTDAYSTRYPLKLQQAQEQFLHLTDSVLRKAVRETMSTEESVRLIHGSHAELGIGEVTEEGSVRKIRIPACAAVLYQTEEGNYASVTKKFDIIAQTDAEPGNEILWNCEIVQMEALLSAAGIELRLSTELKLREQKRFEVSTVSEAELDQEHSLHNAAKPSVVLRFVTQDESLWDIAKRYGTTCKAICGANKMDEGKMPGNQMLLIPRGR